MVRTINTLNEMTFELPQGWQVTSDKYKLMNGQGFINTENYLSDNGQVISLFEIHRDPDEFFESYQSLVEKYNKVTDMFELEKQFTLRFGEFEFPVYIIKGFKETLIHIMQVFINCGDSLGCFMINIENVSDDVKEMVRKNSLFSTLVKILRTVK